MRSLIILLALLPLACSGQYHPSDGVTASPELLPYCEDAVSRWERATGLRPSCTEGRPMYVRDLGDTIGGITYGTEVIVSTRWPAQLRQIVTHELGHVMHGKGEHPGCGGLMAPTPKHEDTRINECDVAWLCDVAPCTAFAEEAP